MAHPNDYLGKAGVVVIDTNNGAFAAPDNRYIIAIQNMGAARDGTDDTFTVKYFNLCQFPWLGNRSGEEPQDLGCFSHQIDALVSP